MSLGNSKNTTTNTSPTVAGDDIEEFIIPESPKGRYLELDIVSTWGDKHYVGLNGIELFNSNGNLIKIKEV